VFYKIRDSMLQAGVVRELRAGADRVTLINATGYITWRVLSASEFAMARTWMRGHRTGGEIALHMATFNGDKVSALREEQLWLVDSPLYFAGDFIELSESRMLAARSLDEETQLLLMLLRTASAVNRTAVLPTFRCERAPVVRRGRWGWPLRTLWDMLYAAYDEWGMTGSFMNNSRWQTLLGLNGCPYYFHFDYWALERAGVKFRSSSFFKQPMPADPPDEKSVYRRHAWAGTKVATIYMKSFEEFKHFSQAAASTSPSHVRDFSAAAPSASRLILDWDLLQDSGQLREIVGSYSAAEAQSLLAATEMSFGI
jgi:hypothetical protein